jgi:hypothetical protein
MGSGSSKATTSSSSSSPTAAAEAGGEVKRPNGSGKGRSLLPSSSCFRGSTTPCEGDASAAAVDVEVRAVPLGFVSLAVL